MLGMCSSVQLQARTVLCSYRHVHFCAVTGTYSSVQLQSRTVLCSYRHVHTSILYCIAVKCTSEEQNFCSQFDPILDKEIILTLN